MRTMTLLGTIVLGVAASLAGCKWTDFDDLEKNTWVRATEDPDLGSSDYAVAVAGVTTSSKGGRIAVLSDDSATYSTIDYNSAGGADVGADPIKLSDDHIGALADIPALATDASGRVGLAEKSLTGGNFAVVFGSPTGPDAIEFMSAEIPTPAPAGALFVGDTLLFAAGTTAYVVAASGGMPTACKLQDMASMPIQIAGIAATDKRLLVWTKAGALFNYDLSMILPTCSGGAVDPAAGSYTDSSFMPADNATVLVSGNFALLAGHVMGQHAAQVTVIDLTTFAPVGTTPVVIDGLHTAILGNFGGTKYLVAGIPDKHVDKVACGAVELYELDDTTGVLSETPSETLHDADPEAGQEFGRSLTTMMYNGNEVLVVAANGEVFAYYRTSLYDHLP